MALRCVVVTPERTELDREAEYVSLPMYAEIPDEHLEIGRIRNGHLPGRIAGH